MRIQGARAGIATEIIRRGTAQDILPDDLEWFVKEKLVDPRTGEPEMLLYWEAIRNDILRVTYKIMVQGGRPALIIEEASVSTGSVSWGDPTKMLSHAMALGLCPDGSLVLACTLGVYQVVHR